MDTLEDIRNLIAADESETLEIKSSTGERPQVAESVCAMLNQRGGRVVIGVEPDGRIVGQQVSDDTIKRLSGDLGRIEPIAMPSIERVAVEGDKELVVVRVPPGSNRPYTHGGQALIRVGNTNRRLTQNEYNQILVERLHGESRWETQIADGWTVEDLDASEIIRTVDDAVSRGRLNPQVSRAPLDLLRGMNLIRDEQLVRAAVVLFGGQARLQSRYQQCLLRVAKFRGIDQSEFLDNRQFHGNAFELLSAAERFLQDNLPIAGRFTPSQLARVDEPLYPRLATREALANAFCHRDYSIGGGSVGVAIYDDRLEITSTGGLHFGLTAQALFEPHESQPWNPLIARAFYLRGIIESWGRGIASMVDLTNSAGLPNPEIEEIVGGVVVRFRPSRYVPPQRVAHDLSERQRMILAALDESPIGLPLREIVENLDGTATRRQVQLDLALLRSLSLIDFAGRGLGARWKRL